MDSNINLKRKMPWQLTAYVFKVHCSVSVLESEKMQRARKKLLERGNGEGGGEARENTRLIFQNGPHGEPFRSP